MIPQFKYKHLLYHLQGLVTFQLGNLCQKIVILGKGQGKIMHFR